MRIGIPKEIKDHEYRVGATPAMVRALIEAGAQVFVESEAGAAVGYLDAHYRQVGAHVYEEVERIWDCDMIIKVKEPQASEIEKMHEGQIIYGYLHLAPDREQTVGLLNKGVLAIAYETITDARGRLPLLAPMSEIAGRISAHVGAHCLHMSSGGCGSLIGGVAGVAPANVVVIGGGVSGTQALRMALGLGGDVTVLDTNLDRLRTLDCVYGPALTTLYSNATNLEESLVKADLVIGAVLVAGDKAPKLLTRELVQRMKKGAVFVDISIDQGGCSETSRPTSHTNPTYIDEGVVHYCVTNMPGACAKTATQALTHATVGHAKAILEKGVSKALLEDAHLLAGLNVAFGQVTHSAVARALGLNYMDPREALSGLSVRAV